MTHQWPEGDLIYVRNARRRHVSRGAEDRIFGIFALHYDEDGNSYYYPVDRERQPGVQSYWLLDPRYDLILDWEPVDVAKLLEEFGGRRP